MRSNSLARSVAGVALVIGITAGGLAGAGAGFAAPQPTAGAGAAEAGDVGVRAVNNLGLSTQQAKYVQCFLRVESTYTGAIDGALGKGSWAAMQRHLAAYWGYPANQIDGAVGPNTLKALQRMLAYGYGYSGSIDGLDGPKTRAAFARFANDQRGYC
ncbi:peptidoglycan-binding domain-containing protein [Streptomyces sp. NPDC049881]|uniref:peptidoglycan-binding domain-containing protein n=1 Tax=Streptomyces sp. NPDC049881 TaxID=3155778 RepID=UPI003446DC1F